MITGYTYFIFLSDINPSTIENKNGYADIYRKEGVPCIILITCKDNTSDGQTVHIAYLEETSTY